MRCQKKGGNAKRKKFKSSMKTIEKVVFELPVARMAVTRIMRASAAMPAPRITKANWVGSILMQERGVNVKN